MKISALILTSNEEEMIDDCLRQLNFVDEIIVLDQNSRDKTVEIARRYTTHIFKTHQEAFDKNRNTLAKMAKGDWLLYVDADERLNEALVKEIKTAMRNNQHEAYYFPRKNIILGKWLRHTGFWPDYVPRLFKRTRLIKWQGRVHESPQITGDFGYLKTPLSHFTAPNMSQMFEKSTKWAKIEAELFSQNSYPKVTILRVIAAMFFEFFSRFFKKKGFLDGKVGLIESFYQALHKAMIFTYLWELQNDTNKSKGLW